MVEDKNTGFLTLNKYKKTDKHPKWKGKTNVQDEQLEIAIWERTSKKDGKPYLYVSFTTEEEAKKYKKKDSPDGVSEQFNSDDLPF